MDTLFGNAYDRREAIYVLMGAVIVAINTGFVNGVTMSGTFLEDSESVIEDSDYINKSKQGVSGTGGSFTGNAIALVTGDWANYSNTTYLLLAYIFGAFIPAIITPRAHKHVIEPKYGPTFMIGALFLLASSLCATFGVPSRFIFYFATAALGVQNGIASIYSANLIRCTLTGTSTDLGLIFAQALRGEFKKFIRGTLICIIVTNYWIGGMISVPIVNALGTRSMYVAAGMYFLLGCLCILYSITELGVSVFAALCGSWEWKEVLDELFDDDDAIHTEEDLMKVFDDIDADKNGSIEMEELRKALEKSGKVKDFKLKALMRAADINHDNLIEREEWADLANNITKKEKAV
jgi:uncharacterized membrane protein YoaK (UPF0700 family)